MADPLSVAIFCEDVVHEGLLGSLLRRLAGEAKRTVTIRTASGRGGHGRAMAELRAFAETEPSADLIVAAIDANCSRWAQARSEIEKVIDRFPRRAIACPDPHIERWYLADPEGLKKALGARAALGKRKCKRDYYKQRLASALVNAGHQVTLGGAEFATEIVAAMDLYRAGKNEPSLKHFLEAVRQVLSSVT